MRKTILWEDIDDFLGEDRHLFQVTDVLVCPRHNWCSDGMRCTCKTALTITLEEEEDG